MANPIDRRTLPGVVFDCFNFLFLGIFALTVFYPFWHLLITSFSDRLQINSLGFHFWISEWHPEAYKYVFSNNQIGIGYLNSIFKTVVGTALNVVLCFAVAYPLSKKNLPRRNLITLYFIGTMFFSGGLIPQFLLIRRIGLMDTRWVLIVPGAVSAGSIIIARNYLMTIDVALEESAFMDGADVLTILFKIIIPIAKPVVAVVALWAAVGHWNAWFDALIYIRSKNKEVLQLVLQRMMNLLNFMKELEEVELKLLIEVPSEAAQAATVLITIGPIILVYPFVQRYFVKGIMIGSLKG